MKTETKELLFNYLMLFGIILIFLIGIFLIAYFFITQTSECINSPFVFGAKKLEDKFYANVSGTILLKDLNNENNIQSILFDSKEIYTQDEKWDLNVINVKE